MPNTIKHIVLADDDEDDVQLIQDAIEDSCPDIILRVATDGVQLIELINHQPKPDVILLDLNMPLKSGKQCLEEIRANDDFEDVPVVILSTSNRQRDIDDCIKRGATHYFVKPHSLDGMKMFAKSICSGSL